ncbi:MAG TPA: hypothetical protein PLN33_19150 [Hyphomonadaceae bacterium]|nr:hypothetical protein [Hyphomonadaceae bacterium]HPN06254.1 hypothetical protein [Hyphomonadaceae bacterium]
MKRLLATAALVSALAACTTTGVASTVATTTAAATVAKSPYESEILATVDRFLLAIGNHDDEALEEVLITEGVSWIQTIEPGKEGPVRPYTNASMMEPDPDADPFIERYWNPTVQVRGLMAHVWAPYELRDNGEQVHCGIDAFQLIHLDGAWRVASILSTMEPESCAALAQPSPADMRPRDGWKETPNQ